MASPSGESGTGSHHSAGREPRDPAERSGGKESQDAVRGGTAGGIWNRGSPALPPGRRARTVPGGPGSATTAPRRPPAGSRRRGQGTNGRHERFGMRRRGRARARHRRRLLGTGFALSPRGDPRTAQAGREPLARYRSRARARHFDRPGRRLRKRASLRRRRGIGEPSPARSSARERPYFSPPASFVDRAGRRIPRLSAPGIPRVFDGHRNHGREGVGRADALLRTAVLSGFRGSVPRDGAASRDLARFLARRRFGARDDSPSPDRRRSIVRRDLRSGRCLDGRLRGRERATS